MILVFILLGLFILSNLIMFILIISSINIQIKKLHIYNIENKVNLDFILELSINILNEFKIFKITIDNDKIKNLFSFKNINIEKLKDNKEINKLILKEIKKIKFNIEYFKLDGYFSCFNTILSANIYLIIQIIIPIIIASNLECKYINKLQFLNTNQNIINIDFSCIISLKIVNIINALIRIKKKGGKDIYGKSSNRKSYAYCNE